MQTIWLSFGIDKANKTLNRNIKALPLKPARYSIKCVTIAMFFKVATVLSLALAVSAVEFRIKNNEQGPVWIGIQGNDGREPLASGGFVLEQGEQVR